MNAIPNTWPPSAAGVAVAADDLSSHADCANFIAHANGRMMLTAEATPADALLLALADTDSQFTAAPLCA